MPAPVIGSLAGGINDAAPGGSEELGLSATQPVGSRSGATWDGSGLFSPGTVPGSSHPASLRNKSRSHGTVPGTNASCNSLTSIPRQDSLPAPIIPGELETSEGCEASEAEQGSSQNNMSRLRRPSMRESQSLGMQRTGSQLSHASVSSRGLRSRGQTTANPLSRSAHAPKLRRQNTNDSDASPATDSLAGAPSPGPHARFQQQHGILSSLTGNEPPSPTSPRGSRRNPRPRQSFSESVKDRDCDTPPTLAPATARGGPPGARRFSEELPESSRALMRQLQQVQEEQLGVLPHTPSFRPPLPFLPWVPDGPMSECTSNGPTSPEVSTSIENKSPDASPHLLPTALQPASVRAAQGHRRRRHTGRGTSSRHSKILCWERRKIRKACQKFLGARPYKGLLAVATFHLLFSNDLYYLLLPKGADVYVLWVTFVITFVLFLEILLSIGAWARQYTRSVFFYMDLIAWASVVPDLLVLFNVIEAGGTGPNLALARIGRAARVGTRLGRLGRMHTYLNRCYGCCDGHGGDPEDFDVERPASPDLAVGKGPAPGQKETEVGQLIKRRLVSKNSIFMLLILLGAILLSPAIAGTTDHQEAGLRIFLRHVGTSAAQSSLDEYHLSLNGGLLRLEVDGAAVASHGDTNDYRDQDILTYCRSVNGLRGCVWLLIDDTNRLAAWLSVALTVFATLMIVSFNAVVIYDVQVVLLAPVERMVALVDVLVVNPLARINWGTPAQERGEMGLLIRAIKKLGALIQVGFGEAGAEVVSQNLQHGDLFTMLPGRNVQAIFSFCDIRNFTQATEVLRQDVMFFVNSVAQIVHGTVGECGGQPNKNIGDAFLSVWRLGDAHFADGDTPVGDIPLPELQVDEPREHADLFDKPEEAAEEANVLSRAESIPRAQENGEARLSTKRFSDLAGFNALRRASSGTTQEPEPTYTAHVSPGLTASRGLTAENALAYALLVRERIHLDPIVKTITAKVDADYKCNLGHGLHYGWAVEGAIGSELKIDASYLSPHVNVAARLEAATKQYGASVLLSAEFRALLSPYTQRHYTRPIDCVMLKGTQYARVIYSADAMDPTEWPLRFSFVPMDDEALEAAAMQRTFRQSSMHSTGGAGSGLAATREGMEDREDTVPGLDIPLSSLLPALPASGFPSMSLPSGYSSSGGAPEREERSDTQNFLAVARAQQRLPQPHGTPKSLPSDANISSPSTLEGSPRPAPAVPDPKTAEPGVLVHLSLQRLSAMAVNSYIVGMWPSAAEMLQAIQRVRPGDGPSAVLLAYLQEHNFTAPPEWPGYRVLTDK
eukprot:TRINITY_DN24836_c1_g1_i1.p1 TRINITY_DN24836_c1_g1~~TRINITY_DN24836_c1_g1_i1.p1  ORF type:complete len:1291 (+),score=371.94 TRINITY_DN24836_c1_g1_i1:72-3944(+)